MARKLVSHSDPAQDAYYTHVNQNQILVDAVDDIWEPLPIDDIVIVVTKDRVIRPRQADDESMTSLLKVSSITPRAPGHFWLRSSVPFLLLVLRAIPFSPQSI